MPGSTTEPNRYSDTGDQDLHLVRRAQAGDTACFGDLVRRYERTVYGIVSRMTPSKDDADDLVQEVFVSAWRALPRFRGDSLFGTWLHTIAVNATLKKLQKEKRRPTVSIDDEDNGLEARLGDESVQTAFEKVCSDEEKRAVREALGSLSDNHRMSVVLFYFENYSCDDIARMMGCSVGTVWSRLHYACKKLKAVLSAEGQSHAGSPAGRLL